MLGNVVLFCLSVVVTSGAALQSGASLHNVECDSSLGIIRNCDLYISDTFNISSDTSLEDVVITCTAHNSPCLYISPNTTLTISSSSLTALYPRRCMLMGEGSILEMDLVDVDGFHGAVLLAKDGDNQVTITRSKMRNNNAGGEGVMLVINGAVSVSDSVFDDNTGTTGVLAGIDSVIHMTSCNMSNNAAPGPHVSSGAGDIIGGRVEISDCRFIGNLGKAGGAITVEHSEADIRSTLFSGNTGGYGGAVLVGSSNAVITDTIFIGNTAPHGGALGIADVTGGDKTITVITGQSKFANNAATLKGHAIACAANQKEDVTIHVHKNATMQHQHVYNYLNNCRMIGDMFWDPSTNGDTKVKGLAERFGWCFL